MAEYTGTINGEEFTISAEEVKEAFNQTEENYDPHQYSPWHYIEINGEKKPPKDVFKNIKQIKDAGLEKGNFDTPTAERFIEGSGIETYNEEERANEEFVELLKEISKKYKKIEPGTPQDKEKEVFDLIEKRAPILLKHIVVTSTERKWEKNVEIKGSSGNGNWSYVPWVSIQTEDDERLDYGMNPVIFIDSQHDSLYLALNQKVGKADKRGDRPLSDLKETTQRMQEKYDLPGFQSGPFEIEDVGGIGAKYGPASVYYKKYSLDDLDIEEFESDIGKIAKFFFENLNRDEENSSDSKLSELTEKQEFNVDIPDSLYFDDEDAIRAEIEASLNSGKNIILTGPPGTGKTKLAKDIAKQISGEKDDYVGNSTVDGHIFTTATSDWTAFDTIGGYMPSGDSDQLNFNPGQFLKCFRDGDVTNKWLVIDEINRADIDKAFGPLFSVLSGDTVELPYEKEGVIKIQKLNDELAEEELREIENSSNVYPVTDSWRLIATMNTRDKSSLYEMSYAFMRRFNFVHVDIPELEDNDDEPRYELLNPNIDDSFAAVWDEDTSIPVSQVLSDEDLYQEITDLWIKVNNYSKIGPSIVLDIISFISEFDGDNSQALSYATTSLIYPQFEGMRPNEVRSFVESCRDLDINQEILKRKAEDMLGAEFESNEKDSS